MGGFERKEAGPRREHELPTSIHKDLLLLPTLPEGARNLDTGRRGMGRVRMEGEGKPARVCVREVSGFS